MSDARGYFTVIPTYARRLTVVPKRPARAADGGFRRFASEFPTTPRTGWSWLIDAPARGDAHIDLDVPAELFARR